jgi:hypothetical protein
MPPKAPSPEEPEAVVPDETEKPVEREKPKDSRNGLHVLHSNGRVALHFGVLGKKGEEEDGFAYYSDGKIAAMVQRMGAGYYTYFYDSQGGARKQGELLASFDPFGVGQVYYQNGKNRMTINMDTMWMYDDKGDVMRIVDWEKKKLKEDAERKKGTAEDKVCEVFEVSLNGHLTLRMVNRQDMRVDIKIGLVSHSIPCGERLTRTSTYLQKVTSQHKWGEYRGKFEIDLSQTDGHRWHNTPNHYQKPKIHLIPDDQQLCQLMEKCGSIHADDKAGKFNTTAFITKETVAELSDNNKDDPLIASSNNSEGRRSASPTKAAKPRIDNKLQKVDKYRLLRIKLDEIQPKQYDKFLATVQSDVVVMVVCLSSWAPASKKVEATMEEVNADIVRSQQDQHESPLPYRLVKFDMSSHLLRDRHHIRTVPMFLCYYSGRLVYANNTLNGLGTRKEDAMAQLELSLSAGKGSAFMPDDYKFPVVDNNLMDGVFKRLDNIFSTPGMR